MLTWSPVISSHRKPVTRWVRTLQLIRSNKLTFDLGTAERTNGAIPSADVDCWFAGDNEFILPADFERWFAEDDSALELTPAVHVFLAVLNAVGSECCNRCSEPVACQPPREKSTAPYATHASIRKYSFSEHLHSTPRSFQNCTFN